MKNLLILLLLIPTVVVAQTEPIDNFPNENGKIIYQEVVEYDNNRTTTEIYLDVRKWMVENFKSSKSVIELDDAENGIIMGKGFISKGHIKFVSNPQQWFTLKVEIKDGRYRYTLTDIIYEFSLSMGSEYEEFSEPLEQWITPSEDLKGRKRERVVSSLNKYCQELNHEFSSIISSLKETIATTPDEW